MNILKTITDFLIWLLFNITIILTITLITIGTYYLITDPQWSDLLLYGASIITLAMHYGVRSLPTTGSGGG